MKLMIVAAFAFVAAVTADVIVEPVKIVRSEFKQQPEGSYNFGYESADGSVREETGEVKEVPNEENKLQKVVVVRGSYSYINTDGEPETITYYADETGYHAEGKSIPKAPEV